MPLIDHSSYPGAPRYQWRGHLQTIIPNTLRRITFDYQRQRLELADGDFLDLDWRERDDCDKLVIITHGLEGDSSRPYVRGMAKTFWDKGWNVLAWHCRSCSGEMNRNFCLYYHGETHDISQVIDLAISKKKYKKIVLIGFSMGGSITLKYMGEKGQQLPDEIRAGIAFSTPCDFPASERVTEHRKNRVYFSRFFNSLREKIRAKERQFPDSLPVEHLNRIRTWREFDHYYSAPLNKFTSVEDFHYAASANNYIPDIRRPALLINAANDPMLTPECSPVSLARQHKYFYLEVPTQGGHVGFAQRGGGYWSEDRALEFAEHHLN